MTSYHKTSFGLFGLFCVLVLQGCNGKVDADRGDAVAEPHLEAKEELISRVFVRAQEQYRHMLDQIEDNDPLLQPRGLHGDGSLNLVESWDWTSGFFPGSLWYLYEYTGDEKWREHAETFTNVLDSIQHLKWTHDLGFMVQDSFGHGYRLTGNTAYRQTVIEAAASLATRYRPVARVIQSWDTTPNMGWIAERGWDMPVIIDNMMNLNLLFRAFEFTGNQEYYDIADNHAMTTLQNHFREDNSSYHVVDYNNETGAVRSRQTAQGYADSSSWARGQAWGLYGYTEAYRETGREEYLQQAMKIADYITNSDKVPNDHIPYWDYDAPNIPDEPRDASAAAITASALLELQGYAAEQKEAYLLYAESILRMLSSDDYLATTGENGGFILEHSVGNIHTGEENDRPLNYADYYYLEAMIRWGALK